MNTDPNTPIPPTSMMPPPLPDTESAAPRRSGMLCPYCGNYSGSKKECDKCKGLFEPLSRQASQNGMGPWFIRDEANPFRPGCSYATMRMLVSRKRIVAESILRGPSTRQFWTFAKNTPGIAHLLGECHACHKSAIAEAAHCPHCNASFGVEEDRQYLGLAEVRVIPGQVMPEATRLTARAAAGAAAASALSEQARSRAVFASDSAAIPLDESGAEHVEAAPAAYEPIRNPARPARSTPTMSDRDIDDLLRRSGSGERVKRSATLVVVLVMAALVAVVLMIVLAVVMYASAAKNAGNGPTGTAATTPSPAPSVPASPAKAPGK